MNILNKVVDAIMLTSYVVGIVLFWGTPWANFCFVFIIFSVFLAFFETRYEIKEVKNEKENRNG